MKLINYKFNTKTNLIDAICSIKDIKKIQDDHLKELELSNKLPLTLMTVDIEVCFPDGIIDSTYFGDNSNKLICIGCGFGNVKENSSTKLCIT